MIVVAKIILWALAVVGGWVLLLHFLDWLRWVWRNR